MNDFVPDFAIVPRLLIKSFFVIPIPVSVIDIVLLFLSATSLISNFGSLSSTDLSVKD